MESTSTSPIVTTPTNELELHLVDRQVQLHDILGQVHKSIEQHQANLRKLEVSRISLSAQVQLVTDLITKFHEIKAKAAAV